MRVSNLVALIRLLPGVARQALVNNARTTAPLFADSLLSEPFGCREAQQMAMPVLLIEGEKTSPGMRPIGTRLLERPPDSRRAVLPGAGHTIQFDAPERMAVVVAAFLARCKAGPRSVRAADLGQMGRSLVVC